MAMDDDGLIPAALEQRAQGQPDAGVRLHDPDLPEPERPHGPRGPPPRDRRARPGGRSHADPRGRPLRADPLRGHRAAVDVRPRARAVDLHLVVLEDDLAGPPRRLVHPPRGRSRAPLDRASPTRPTSRPSLLSEAVVYEFIRRGSFEPNLDARQRPPEGAPRRDARRARQAPVRRRRWSRPEGGYFIWLELPEGTNAKEVLDRAEGVTAVLGTDFGGADEHAPPRLQLRLARRDRRGRRAARRRGRLDASQRRERPARAAAGRAAAGAAERGRARRPGTSGTGARGRARRARCDGSSSPGRWGVLAHDAPAGKGGGRVQTRCDPTHARPPIKGLPGEKTRSFRAFRTGRKFPGF